MKGGDILKTIFLNIRTAFYAAMLALSLAACGKGELSQETSDVGQQEQIADTQSEPVLPEEAFLPPELTIGGYSARLIDETSDLNMYLVEIYTSESTSDLSLSPITCAETLGTALLQSGVSNIAAGSNLYLSFTGLDAVQDETVYTFAVSSGEKFDPQDYASMYYLAVDGSGNIYLMPDATGAWERWIPTEKIETGVFYVEAVMQTSDSGENPSAQDSAKAAWEAMKQHGAPAGAPGRNIIFRFMGVETFDEEDLYVYSIELDYGDGAEPIFRVGVSYSGEVVCDAGSESWVPLPYGDLFGGQSAVLPEDESLD
ncbi:MAG: hypothetical protein QM697_06990 [Lachnospiraceae bacterium]